MCLLNNFSTVPFRCLVHSLTRKLLSKGQINTAAYNKWKRIGKTVCSLVNVLKDHNSLSFRKDVLTCSGIVMAPKLAWWIEEHLVGT